MYANHILDFCFRDLAILTTFAAFVAALLAFPDVAAAAPLPDLLELDFELPVLADAVELEAEADESELEAVELEAEAVELEPESFELEPESVELEADADPALLLEAPPC